MSVPYFYIIGWSIHDVWYQGIQYGKKSHPSNLWNTYFTSSNYVKEFAKIHGKPDIIETMIFQTAEEAIAYEIESQIKCDVLNDRRWLNKNVSGAILMDDQVKLKLSEANLKRLSDPEFLARKKLFENDPLYKKKQSDHMKEIWKDPLKNVNRIKYFKDDTFSPKRSATSAKGWSDERRKKASELNKLRWSDPKWKENRMKILTSDEQKNKIKKGMSK